MKTLNLLLVNVVNNIIIPTRAQKKPFPNSCTINILQVLKTNSFRETARTKFSRQIFQSPITPPKIIEPEWDYITHNQAWCLSVIQSFSEIRLKILEESRRQAESGRTDERTDGLSFGFKNAPHKQLSMRTDRRNSKQIGDVTSQAF